MNPLHALYVLLAFTLASSALLVALRAAYARGYMHGEEHGEKTTQAALHGEMRRARLRLLELSGLTEDQAFAAYRAWMQGHDDPLGRRAVKVLGVRG